MLRLKFESANILVQEIMTDDSIIKQALKVVLKEPVSESQIVPDPEQYDLDALLTLVLDASPEPDVNAYYEAQRQSGRNLSSLMSELLESERVKNRLSKVRQRQDPTQTDLQHLSSLLELMMGYAVAKDDLQYRAGKLQEDGSSLRAFDDIFKSEAFQGRVRSMRNLFVNPGHFYSPVFDVESLDTKTLSTSRKTAINNIEIDKVGMIELWNRLVPFIQAMPFPKDKTDEFRYYFNNPAFNFGDAAIYFALLQELKPKRVIEIGSGYSSALLLDTVDRFFDQRPDITFIDPYPEFLNMLIADDPGHAAVIGKIVQDVDLEIFYELEAGDVLFIDSTHVLKTQSDVHWELTEILPRLKPGVIIHFHDIFWPFEYRELWITNPPRSWNEVYALQLFLMNQTDYEIMFFNDYFAMQCTDRANKDVPGFATSDSAGLWLRKTGKTS